MSAVSLPPRTGAGRDPRLDVFRGLGLAIILIAHVPNNPWTLWIPARFGFSDATEVFVFLSGVASALAYGRVFDAGGLAAGSRRIARRIGQIYLAHLGIFAAIAALMLAAGTAPSGEPYVNTLNLQHFFADPAGLVPAFLRLAYVPNYFDILPMYLVILALMPPLMALERLWRFAPVLASALLWGLAQTGALDLPAEPWSDRTWFFNPFGWQLLFYLGFFLMRGTLPVPRPDRRLLLLAALVVLAGVPVAWHPAREAQPVLAAIAESLAPLTAKTWFGALRLLHFAALAWLCLQAAGPRGQRLTGPVAAGLASLGRQSLNIFILSMIGAQLLGMLLDLAGRGPLAAAAVNLAGLAALIAVAAVLNRVRSGRAARPMPPSLTGLGSPV